jgi:hypothetical protein
MNSHPFLSCPASRPRRKNIRALFAGALAVFCLGGHDLRASTIADWTFNAANPVADSSGNGNTLALTGNLTFSSDVATNAPGATNSAVFDGGSYAQTVATLNLTPYDQLTIEFFAKFTTANGLQMFYTQNNPNNVQGGFYLDTGEAGPATQQFSKGTAAGFETDQCPEPVDGAWHHYALTIDEHGASPVVKIYVDGYMVDTGGATAAIQAFLNDYFTIGAYPPNYIFLYQGLMGEMRISSGILSPAQFLIGPQPPVIFVAREPVSRFTLTNNPVTFSVAATVQGGNPPPTLLYQWQKNGVNISGATSNAYTLQNPAASDDSAQFDVVLTASGATTFTSTNATLTVGTNPIVADWKFNAANPTSDSSGNGNTLALNGNITFSSDVSTNDPGATNSAAFDGASYAQTVGTLNLTPYNQLTIEFFAKFTTGSGLKMFYAQNNPNNVQGAFYADTGEAGPARQKVAQKTAGGVFLIDSAPEPTDGAWHHYALTMDESGTNAVFKIFVDGYQLDGAGATGSIQTLLNDYFTIGAYPPTYVFGYPGLMGEFRITCAILNPAQFLIGAGIPRIFISQQPSNTGVATNSPATFKVFATVLAGGTPPALQYQWRKNGVNISGATGSSYTLLNPALNDNSAGFDVVLTAAPATTVTSDSATLTVLTNAALAFWKFDAADPTADSSGNGNVLAFNGNITVSGDAPATATGSSNSVVFDGGSYAQTVNTMDFTPFNQLTIEFFAKYSSGSPLQMFYAVNNVNNAQGAFYLDTGEAGPTSLKISQRTSGTSFETYQAPEPTDGTWHHYAVTMDESGLNPVFTIYVDGVAVGSAGQAGGIQSFITDYFTIGGFPPGYNFLYQGMMDEMRISTGILNTGQFLSGPARLRISASPGQVVISWPQNAGPFTLQQAGTLSGAWTPVTTTPAAVGNNWQVTAPTTAATKFYRLVR